MLGIKEKVNKVVFPSSVSPAKLAHSRRTENIDWGRERRNKNASNVVTALKEVVLILADHFGNNKFSQSVNKHLLSTYCMPGTI